MTESGEGAFVGFGELETVHRRRSSDPLRGSVRGAEEAEVPAPDRVRGVGCRGVGHRGSPFGGAWCTGWRDPTVSLCAVSIGDRRHGPADGVPGRVRQMVETPGRRPVLLVSACLLGAACTYRADDNRDDAVGRLGERFDLVPVCPEQAGGLPTPRPPAEIEPGGRVVTRVGDDVTDAFRRGAETAVEIADRRGAIAAVLKARSPSCGSRQVHDGTFTGRLVDGEGITAAALRSVGIEVADEEEIANDDGLLDRWADGEP